MCEKVRHDELFHIFICLFLLRNSDFTAPTFGVRNLFIGRGVVARRLVSFYFIVWPGD